MPTKQETLQNYFNLSEAQLITFINSETFDPADLSGIFSYNAYNNKTEIVKAFLAKTKPTQEELDMCFGGQILNQEILQLLLPIKPSPESLGRMVYSICTNFQMQETEVPEVNSFSKEEKKANLSIVQLLMESGAKLQEHQNYDAAKICFDNDNIALFEKYFNPPEAQKWHLQFATRPGNEKLKTYLLAKKINYNSPDGLALLMGAMNNDKNLFFTILPFVNDVNVLIDPYSSLLDSAISTDDLEIIKAIIAKGGMPNFNGKNILLQAINSKDSQLPKLLLETFDLDFRINNDECLVAACNFQKVKIAKMLLEKGADVHAQKNACLKTATKNKNTELIAILKQFGANELDLAPYKFYCDVATANFETLWKEWLIYYKKNFPSAELPMVVCDEHLFIEEPVSDEEISICEEKIGMKLNSELQTIYKHCTQGEYLFFGQLLYRPSKIAESLRCWIDIGFIDLVENDQSYPVTPPETIKNLYINAKWLAFCSDMNMNHISIDYDPGTKGTMGQIINSGRDQWERFVYANSITELARKVMHRIEANEAEISPEGYFNISPACGGGIMYDVPELIKTGKW